MVDNFRIELEIPKIIDQYRSRSNELIYIILNFPKTLARLVINEISRRLKTSRLYDTKNTLETLEVIEILFDHCGIYFFQHLNDSQFIEKIFSLITENDKEEIQGEKTLKRECLRLIYKFSYFLNGYLWNFTKILDDYESSNSFTPSWTEMESNQVKRLKSKIYPSNAFHHLLPPDCSQELLNDLESQKFLSNLSSSSNSTEYRTINQAKIQSIQSEIRRQNKEKYLESQELILQFLMLNRHMCLLGRVADGESEAAKCIVQDIRMSLNMFKESLVSHSDNISFPIHLTICRDLIKKCSIIVRWYAENVDVSKPEKSVEKLIEFE